MPTYKLTYFNAKGLAELSRLMFAEAGVEYEDDRIESAKWPEVKPTTPLGQLPLLEVDGQVIPQSKAFNRYLARKFGFYGSSDMKAAEVDIVTETLDDILQGLRKFMVEKDEDEKAKKKAVFYGSEGDGPAGMKKMVKLLGSNDYFVGDNITLADFGMLISGDWYLRNNDKAMEDFPALLAHRERIMKRPKISKWIAERPVTEF